MNFSHQPSNHKAWKSAFSVILFLAILSACTEDEIKLLGNQTRCITHRGNTMMGQENSMDAIIASVEVGADGTEFDVVHTKQGIGIMNHDKTLEASSVSKPGQNCPITTPISELSLDEIRNHCILKNGQEISTLDEVLRYLAHTHVFVLLDFKDTPSEHSIATVNRHYAGRNYLVQFIVTFATNLSNAYLLNDRIRSPFLISADSYVPGIENGFDGVEMRKISNLQIQMLKQKSKIISMFDINDVKKMNELRAQGIHFITTDRIDLCLGSK